MIRPDLDQARRQAKELLRAARAGDAGALARMRDDRAPRLADAQRAVAADLGFDSWPFLVAHAEAATGDRGERRARLLTAALNGRPDVAERLLAHDPALADGDLGAALVLGDADAIAAALARDPGLVTREVPGAARRPLSCACHSAFLRPDSPRAPGVRRVIELLLDHGADPNETFDNEYGAMPVLYGAAASPTTWRRLGCCWTAARTRTTTSPSTTPSRPTTSAAWSCCSGAARPCATRTRSATPSPCTMRAGCGCCSSAATCARATRSCATRCSMPASRPWSTC